MSNAETLKKLNYDRARFEALASDYRSKMCVILEPLFKEQFHLTSEILKEEEFKALDSRSYFHSHPKYDLYGHAQRHTEMDLDGPNFYWHEEYSDGEYAGSTMLRPEFIDGSLEEKKEAIRNHYRNFLQKEENEKNAQKLRLIEQAKETLRANGVPV